MTEQLKAISPIDGRYKKNVIKLSEYFSEYALFKYRIWIEIEYFIALAENKFFILKNAQKKELRSLYQHFNINQAKRIKKIEEITRHDIKAVEYFIKEELKKMKLEHVSEWVHFGLTSQDINNSAIPLLWRHAIEGEYLPQLILLIDEIQNLALDWEKIPMLARTHGQAASPTRLGKEMMVFVERLDMQLKLFAEIPSVAKFGGATGNFNAHQIAFPKQNWIKFGNEFIKSLGLQRLQYTTQIEHYDMFGAHCDALKRMNTILIDFCRDVWTYISMDYFKQKTKKGEIGSSAMPHKVNPIDFENAEGNLGLANAIFEHLSSKLPISRLQRDLTDSTVLRNIGVPVAHTLIAIHSMLRGIQKLILNESALHQDLEENWAVVAEAIQTILRRENYPKPYEALKELTRGKGEINQEKIHAFIETLKIPTVVKKELKAISPHNYLGVVKKY